MPPKFMNSTAADFAVAKKPKRKTAFNCKPKPKIKKQPNIKDVPFRFLDLPAEIRVMIYKHLLVESSVELSYTTRRRGSGLSRGRLIKLPGRGQFGLERWISYKPKRKDNKPTLLYPAILRVCESIRVEATPVLYNQPLYFESPHALEKFLSRIAPSTFTRLRKIVVRGWVERLPYWFGALSLAFAMLTTARGLESIHFDRRVSGSFDSGHWDDQWRHTHLAKLIMDQLKFWTQHVNANEGKSAAEILTFDDLIFGSQDEIENDHKVIETRRKMFFEGLQLDQSAPPSHTITNSSKLS